MRILVIDDDADIRTALRRALVLAGHDVVGVEDGESALRAVRDESGLDAVVLDWGLPDIEGVEVCRRMRAAEVDLPILMLTARGAVEDRVAGLDAGADDYLVKPFDVDELHARLRALVRRAAPQAPVSSTAPLTLADLTLEPDSMLVRRGERQIQLSRTEFALLETFLRHPGVVLGRERLMREVWDYDFGGNTNNLDVYVSYLRRKLESDGEPRLVHTVRGVGFVARENP
jgi:two-component system, OmpR family, response regulator MprA